MKGSRGRDMTEAGRQTKQVRETRKARENCAWQTLLWDAHRIADGHPAAGDDVAASEAKTGCCHRWN